ncbi:DUF2000 family protein [Streptomyces fumanus]|uniref:Uncharacterized protein n=1 Tax=Streptomyces fumanus TaxID=67302 RepID=A0A919AWF6_9ACTN|nr:DUF2000 family protein [Streptomyces fumanus]GHF28088.1 hypothetical protein GCM10018772_62210 [Streptomyces fumanus]
MPTAAQPDSRDEDLADHPRGRAEPEMRERRSTAAVLGVTLGVRLPDVDGPDIKTADGHNLGPISRHAKPVHTLDAATVNGLHAVAREHADVVVAALGDAMPDSCGQLSRVSAYTVIASRW